MPGSIRRGALGLVVGIVVGVGACAGDGSGSPAASEPSPASTDARGELTVEAGDVALLTPEGKSWIDPEVLRRGGQSLMTWQEPDGGVWLAEVDPDTGVLADGSVAQLGDSAAPLGRTFNGPEFGVDQTGWAVYYTRLVDGRQQVARVGADGTLEVLTGGDEHFSPLPTAQPSSATTRLVMLRRPPEWGTVLWVDPADPEAEHEVVHLGERTPGDARWAVGTATFVTNVHPDQPGQLSLVNTDTGAVVAVTDEPGLKSRPYAWEWPKPDGGLLVLAIVDGTELVVWGDDGNGEWQRRATLTSPDPTHPVLGSPEPFVAGGRSYVSLTAQDASSPSQQVWIVGVDPDAPFEQRCDDGDAGPISRSDPEVLLGAEQAFVFYNVFDPDGAGVYRCATGIRP